MESKNKAFQRYHILHGLPKPYKFKIEYIADQLYTNTRIKIRI